MTEILLTAWSAVVDWWCTATVTQLCQGAALLTGLLILLALVWSTRRRKAKEAPTHPAKSLMGERVIVRLPEDRSAERVALAAIDAMKRIAANQDLTMRWLAFYLTAKILDSQKDRPKQNAEE